MGKYSIQTLTRIINDLLSSGHEGDYWDYKREWPPKTENTDLLKDIISFANTAHSKDCFLIIGADDNGLPHKMSLQRRNQNELLGLLARIPKWAAHNQPPVSLEQIEIEDNIFDVIIIYNSNRTPFYLQEDCVPEIKYPAGATAQQKKEIDEKKERKTLRKGVIYTRVEDSTTPFNQTANPFIVEELWKKRFHLLQPIVEQFMLELSVADNWCITDGDKYHNIYRPEFTFQYKEEPASCASFSEYYVKLFPDPNALRMIYTCNYFGTVLKEVYTVSMDGGRWSIPYPKMSTLGINNHRYFFFLMQSDDMIVYQFINSGNPYNCANYFSRLSCYIPRFYDEEERQAFEMWLTKDGNQTEFSTAYQTNWTKESKFTCTNERNEAATGRTIVDMLKRFRRAQTDAKIRNMSAF